MVTSPRRGWGRAAVLLGLAYAAIGIAFAIPATNVRAWRMAAWAMSAIFYAGHIGYERFRLGNSPPSAALHVAVAVALGAFGLAVGANIHSLFTESTHQQHQLLLIALGIWPAITALPAFLIALAVSAVLARTHGSVRRE